MHKMVFLFTGLFLVSGCGNTGTSKVAVTEAYRGTWKLEKQLAPNATDKVTKPVDENDPCKEVQVKGDKVDAGILRIDEWGVVTSAQAIADMNSLYARIGRVTEEGQFVPASGTENEYVSGYSKIASATVSVNPLIHLHAGGDGKFLSMEIRAVANSVAGVYVLNTAQERVYRRVDPIEEKSLIADALVCLSLAQP